MFAKPSPRLLLPNFGRAKKLITFRSALHLEPTTRRFATAVLVPTPPPPTSLSRFLQSSSFACKNQNKVVLANARNNHQQQLRTLFWNRKSDPSKANKTDTTKQEIIQELIARPAGDELPASSATSKIAPTNNNNNTGATGPSTTTSEEALLNVTAKAIASVKDTQEVLEIHPKFPGMLPPPGGYVKCFFPRPFLTETLINILNNEPQGITAVVGAPNVGKTTLLYHVLKGRPVSHMDLRKHGVVNNVDHFIRLIQQHFNKWNYGAEEFANKVKSYFGGTSLFGFTLPGGDIKLDAQDFSRLLQSITDVLYKLRDMNLGVYPVIYVDEADRLKYLVESDEGRLLLKGFLDWAVQTSKTDKLAHIFLASSEGLFIRWIQHYFGVTSNLKTIVIGDLSKEDAKEFIKAYIEGAHVKLYKELDPLYEIEEDKEVQESKENRTVEEVPPSSSTTSSSTAETTGTEEETTSGEGDEEKEREKEEEEEEQLRAKRRTTAAGLVNKVLQFKVQEPDYDRVYEILGGRIHHLRMFAQDYVTSHANFEAAVAPIIAGASRKIYEALTPETFGKTEKKQALAGGQIRCEWTRGQWLMVMYELTRSPNGYVLYQDIKSRVFRDYVEPLEALIEYGLLAYRPIHSMTQPFNIEDMNDVSPRVTAVSPVCLYVMKQILQSKIAPIISLLVKRDDEPDYLEVEINSLPIQLSEFKQAICQAFGEDPDKCRIEKLRRLQPPPPREMAVPPPMPPQQQGEQQQQQQQQQRSTDPILITKDSDLYDCKQHEKIEVVFKKEVN